MKIKIHGFILITFLAGLILSCHSVMQFTDNTAQSAGASGKLNQNVANAISQSARAIGSAAETITPEQEYYIGRAVAANLLSSYKVWNGKPRLTAYLNNICLALTINSPRPNLYHGYRVAILDSNDINAFATSGGHILITRGLINATKSEDALAGVIAHEIAHIQLKHGIRAIRSSRITQALLVTSSSAVGALTGKDVKQLTEVFNESVGEIVQTMVNSGYSQAQELEADGTAMSLMASAGYNPSGLLEMLRMLKELESTQTSLLSLGKTHPSPQIRMTNAEKALERFSVTDNSASRQARFTAAMR